MADDESVFSPVDGFIAGAKKDRQSITVDWQFLVPLIDGVVTREVKHVVKSDGGWLTEVFRHDWLVDDLGVDQVFQNALPPGTVSGWHAHRITTDRIFVNRGTLRIALYDAREASPTYGMINQFTLGDHRPALVVIPPGVWHAVANPGNEVGALLNLVDRAYTYDDPDHWRLPIDTTLIPQRFP